MREQHGLQLPNQRQIRAQADVALEEDDRYYTTKSHTSAIRYDRPGTMQGRPYVAAYPGKRIDIPPRTSAQQPAAATEEGIRRRRRFHLHPLLLLGLGAMLALLLYIAWWNVNTWWTGVQNDWTYTATYRTFSIDEVVGHNHDSSAHPSHFIIQNDKRKILIIELPADDEQKAIMYRAPVLLGTDGEKTPVTISFQPDEQTGRLDMVLHVEDQSYVYVNNGTQFVAPAI